MPSASAPTIDQSEISNDLTENEQLYADEIANIAAWSDAEAAGGTLMEVDFLEGDTVEERQDSLARYDALMNARGEKIDRLLDTAEKRAEREQRQQERLARMQALRSGESTQGAFYNAPAGRGPMGGAPQSQALRGPNVSQSRRVVDVTEMDPNHVTMNFLRGSPPQGGGVPQVVMGRDGKPMEVSGQNQIGQRQLLHPMEFVLRALNGNLHQLGNYQGDFASVQGGIWMNAHEVDLRAINLNASGGLNNAPIQQPPTLYEGPEPIYLTDFIPVMDTNMTSLTWDDTTALNATLPTRKNVGATADTADPVSGKETITVSRLPMTITLDNMLLMSPIPAAEYATEIMNQTWGNIGSTEIVQGDGSAPNQEGIYTRADGAAFRKDFSRGTGNIYANVIRAVNQAQAERTKRGFIGGSAVCEPLLLYALLDHRESGRPVFNSDMWPIRKYGVTWYPTLGLEDGWATTNSRRPIILMNFARNSMNWVQGMNMKMLDQTKAKEGQMELLLEIYNMYQFRQAADIRIIRSAS